MILFFTHICIFLEIELALMGTGAITIAIIILLVIFLVYAVMTALTKSSELSTAIEEWLDPKTEWCAKNLSPPECSFVMANPTIPTSFSTDLTRLDKDESILAITLVARLEAFVNLQDLSYLQVQGLTFVGFPDSPTDTSGMPLCAVWKSDPGVIFIAVRGTKTAAEWSDDFRYDQVAPTFPTCSGTTGEGSVNVGALVHGGIYNEYQNKLLPKVHTIGAMNPKTIFIAGHSLGAIMAFFFAADLSMYTKDIHVYGIASPRIGNRAFANCIAQTITKTVTIANAADPFISIPWIHMPNFGSPVNVYEFSHVHPVFVFDSPTSDVMSAHQLPTYYNAVSSDFPTLLVNHTLS